jgi:hypothetical protein
MNPPTTGYKRLTINLAPEVHDELEALADDQSHHPDLAGRAGRGTPQGG